jgi:hypothetical protein
MLLLTFDIRLLYSQPRLPSIFEEQLLRLPPARLNMSTSESSRSGAAPHAPQGYTYPPRSNEDRGSRAPPPMLPPMSSLLPRNERMEQEPQNPYAARDFPDRTHPLWISESDPNAPVHYIYHPPQPPTLAHSAHYPAEPVSIPHHPQNQISLGYYPDHRRTSQPRPRQIRRIVQRRYDPSKRDTTSEVVSPVSNPHPYISSQPPSQSASPFQQKMPLSPSVPTQSPTSRSMPISGLLSDSPRSDISSVI